MYSVKVKIQPCIRSKAVLSNNFLKELSPLFWENDFIIVSVWFLIPSKPTIASYTPQNWFIPQNRYCCSACMKICAFQYTHIYVYIYIHVYSNISYSYMYVHISKYMCIYIYCKWTYHPSSPLNIQAEEPSWQRWIKIWNEPWRLVKIRHPGGCQGTPWRQSWNALPKGLEGLINRNLKIC